MPIGTGPDSTASCRNPSYEQCRPDRRHPESGGHRPRLRHPERQRVATDGCDAPGRRRLRADRARRIGRLRRRRDRPHDRRAWTLHRHARSRRHQPGDRRRLRLARPLADDRHHVQSQHRSARTAHPDVDRSPHAVQADHQGDAAARTRAHRRDGERSHPPCAQRTDGPGSSRSARGCGGGTGAGADPARSGHARPRSRRRPPTPSRRPAKSSPLPNGRSPSSARPRCGSATRTCCAR